MDFMDRIFYMAVDETVNTPNESLNELYQQLEAAQNAGASLRFALEQLGMSEDEARPVCDAFWKATLDYEHQGFINGMRFGVMLYREMLGTAG